MASPDFVRKLFTSAESGGRPLRSSLAASERKFLTFFDAVLVTRNPWLASFTCKSAIGKMFFHDTHSELDYLSITDLIHQAAITWG